MHSRYLRREQSASQLLFATLLSLAHRKFLFTCLDFKPASCIRRQEHEFIVKAQTDEGHTLHGRRDPHNRVPCQGTIHFVIALKNHLQFQIGNFASQTLALTIFQMIWKGDSHHFSLLYYIVKETRMVEWLYHVNCATCCITPLCTLP